MFWMILNCWIDSGVLLKMCLRVFVMVVLFGRWIVLEDWLEIVLRWGRL